MLNFTNLLEGSINRMSHVFRFSSIPVNRRENVAEHSWYVSMYAFFIAKDYEERWNGEDPIPRVDYGKLLSRALLHDLDESHTGDFLRIVKYGHPDLKRALDEVSVSMINKMQEELGVEFTEPWAQAKADDLEGEIIEIADLLRVVSYVVEEISSGNKHIIHILNEALGYFEAIQLEKDKTFEYNLPRFYIEEVISYVRRARIDHGS